ncbi:MAG: hypothetical protein Tsb002_18280 [Wenzhouxiangellaceae bacterium]
MGRPCCHPWVSADVLLEIAAAMSLKHEDDFQSAANVVGNAALGPVILGGVSADYFNGFVVWQN